MKKALLFAPRVIASLFLAVAFVICFVLAWLMCIVGLLIFAINYRTMRRSGCGGVFHDIFFRKSGLYFVLKAFKCLWQDN